MKAIILAAGGGSRLAPIGTTTPKVLVPILNKPLLQHHIDALRNFVDETIIVIGPNHFGQMIQRYINDHEWPIKITTAIQENPLGTANAYQAAQPFIKSSTPIICLNGDDLYSPRDIHNLAQHQFAILGQPVDDPEKWGILQPDAHGYLQKLVEKPTEYIGNLAYTGAFVGTTEIFDLYHQISPSLRGEYEVTDTLTLLAQKHSLKVESVVDFWLPIGYPWHILQAHDVLLTHLHHNINDATQYPGVTIKGNISIGHNTQIEPGATLHGNIVIGNNCHIHSDAMISGNTVIGSNVIIQNKAIINHSTIFTGSQIGSNARIIYSVIGNNTKLGDNVVTLAQLPHQTSITSTINGKDMATGLVKLGATIGENTELGNNVITKPGVKIWPGCKIKYNQQLNRDIRD